MTIAKKWKIAGTIFMFIPAALFLLFAVGEGIDGWPHYIQLLFVLGLALAGWWRPGVVGYFEIVLGVALAAVYAVTGSRLPISAIIVVEAVVFLPLVMSGYSFLRASR